MRCAWILALAACAAPHAKEKDEYEHYWRASRDIAFEAGMLLHGAVADHVSRSLLEVVWAETKIDAGRKRAIAALGERGAAWAAEAVRRAPDRVEGHFFYSLNLALMTLVTTKMEALLQGLPMRIRNAFRRSIEIDASYSDGAALRLKGKFYTMAPWPFRDHTRALRAFEAALAVAPHAQTYLMLGDLQLLRGRTEAARKAWTESLTAPVDSPMLAFRPLLRQLAQQRLDQMKPEPRVAAPTEPG